MSAVSYSNQSTINHSKSWKNKLDMLAPIRQIINNVDVENAELARKICRLIPTQCPFARQIKFFGHTVISIPPLCKLNPLYEEVIGLKFRAMCYLADQCGEDISSYC